MTWDAVTADQVKGLPWLYVKAGHVEGGAAPGWAIAEGIIAVEEVKHLPLQSAPALPGSGPITRNW